jgi:DNA-binding NarL/FixJ family response regulator
MSNLRIILADDHTLLRQGLALLVSKQPGLQVVGEAGNGAELLELVRARKPDLVVVDLSMPGMGGLEATRRLKAEFPKLRIIILTMHEDASYLTGVAQAGAHGFILKRSAAELLLDAIRTVAAGETWFDPALTAKVLQQELQAPAGPESGARELSEREEQVLRLLAWGYANKEVADKLSLSVKTVETYRHRIAEKLGLRGRVEMVQYARQQGWLETAP